MRLPNGFARSMPMLLAGCRRARDPAGAAHDAESQDLMIGRNALHQKTIWMLNWSLKG